MKRFELVVFICFVGIFLGLFRISSFAAQRMWDGSSDCSKMGDYCPGNAVCVDRKCVSSFGAEISASGCLCCECEACVCEKRPECCLPDGYWDEECVALCGGECGGYALDLDKIDCEGKQCGWDGCFGNCGTCGPGLACADGVCVPCVPDCEGKECGPDGCGGICGWCVLWDGEACLDSVAPSMPQPKCFQLASLGLSEKGCCVSTSVVLTADGEITCSEGYSCRWDRPPFWDENDTGRYDCFPDNSGTCPAGFDSSNCFVPETWVYDCCRDSPYVEYPSACDFTPRRYCNVKWDCGPDGLGGSCGTCNDDEKCVLFKCYPCSADCEGKSCGDDGCGGSCGSCSAGESCVAGQCVPKSGCGKVGDRGCCVGDTLVECLGGKLWESNCNPYDGTELQTIAQHCIWRNGLPPEDYRGDEWTIGRHEDLDEPRYECGTIDEHSTHLVAEDPSGEHPRECDFTPCTRNCEGRSCGDDGCGGTCGGCGDHRDCVDHQCVDRIADPGPDVIEPTDAGDSSEPDVVEPTDVADTLDAVESDVAATDVAHDNMTTDLPRDLGHDVDVTVDVQHDTAGQDDTGPQPKPSAGCGCSTSLPASTGPDGGVLLVLLLCVAIVWLARSRPECRRGR